MNTDATKINTTDTNTTDTSTPQILIFRTNILTIADKLAVKRTLDAHHQIEKWTIDLEDIDRVLRIVSRTLSSPDIIKLVTREGYECAELE